MTHRGRHNFPGARRRNHLYDLCHRWHQADLGYGEDRERAGQSRLRGVVEAASIEVQNSAVRSGKIKYQAALRPDCRSITCNSIIKTMRCG